MCKLIPERKSAVGIVDPSVTTTTTTRTAAIDAAMRDIGDVQEELFTEGVLEYDFASKKVQYTQMEKEQQQNDEEEIVLDGSDVTSATIPPAVFGAGSGHVVATTATNTTHELSNKRVKNADE